MQVLYALTAGIAGYVAAVTYKILGGASWVRNTLLTATLFCGPLLVTFRYSQSHTPPFLPIPGD